MREIKYRAKVMNCKKWIYRQPFHIRGTWYMYNSLWDMVPIEYKTMSQYTGLKDKNGKEIYESHILESPEGIRVDVKFVPEHAAFLVYYSIDGNAQYDYLDNAHKCKVIGNSYQHPELLEGGR
ncbi:YopX family protein [Virgibacillus sediminis]|uniref:YopX family protein n=1 Tax=Virgibacillus sediminis TaxID=202260 RepID=A0ABV7A6C3_9BACI